MAKLIRTSGQSILVPPGISVKPTIHASIPIAVGGRQVDSEEQTAHADFRLEYSRDEGRYQIASFGIDRRGTGVEVTGALWRTIRVHSTIREAIGFALPVWTYPISDLWAAGKQGSPGVLPDFGDGDDGLLLAAMAYRIAEISNETPAMAVAQTLGLKQRTATNGIQRARAAGYLDSVDHQKAARRIAEDVARLNAVPTLSAGEVEEHIANVRARRGDRGGDD